MSRRALLPSAAALALLTLGLLAPAPSARAQDTPGAHQFKVDEAIGMAPTTNVMKALDGRVVMVVALNPWGDRCAEAVPFLNKFHHKYGPLGLTVVGVFEGERKPVEEWVAKNKVAFGVVTLDTDSHDAFKRNYPMDGEPWAHLVDADGNLVFSDHPQNPVTERKIKPLLEASRTPPIVPKELAALQAPLDAGLWAEARTQAQALADGGGLDKQNLAWAKGIVKWVETRKERAFPEADAKAQRGWWWDAWSDYDGYTKRFAGMGGEEEAQAKAAEIRAMPEAAKDLAAGDEIVKAADFIERGKDKQARIKLQRLIKKQKGNRHADRAKVLLARIK